MPHRPPEIDGDARSRGGIVLSAIRSFGEMVRAVLGVPDYARYLAHLERHHAGTEPMSEREFARRALEEKFARPGSRCC